MELTQFSALMDSEFDPVMRRCPEPYLEDVSFSRDLQFLLARDPEAGEGVSGTGRPSPREARLTAFRQTGAATSPTWPYDPHRLHGRMIGRELKRLSLRAGRS
jgi:hypothetical protein